MNTRFFNLDSQRFIYLSIEKKTNRDGIRAIINHLRQYLSTNMYVYTFILDLFRSLDRTLTNAMPFTPFIRTASIESLHLSFFSCRTLNLSFYFRKTGFGSGLPIVNSRVSLNLKVITWQVSIPRLNPIKSVASTNFAISPFCFQIRISL